MVQWSDTKIVAQIRDEYEGLKKFRLDLKQDAEEISKEADGSKSYTSKLIKDIQNKPES